MCGATIRSHIPDEPDTGSHRHHLRRCRPYAAPLAGAERSLDFISEQVRHLPRGGYRNQLKDIASDRCAVALTRVAR